MRTVNSFESYEFILLLSFHVSNLAYSMGTSFTHFTFIFSLVSILLNHYSLLFKVGIFSFHQEMTLITGLNQLLTLDQLSPRQQPLPLHLLTLLGNPQFLPWILKNCTVKFRMKHFQKIMRFLYSLSLTILALDYLYLVYFRKSSCSILVTELFQT